MTKLYPFLKWPGGKRQLMKQIDAHMPPTRDGKFIEPFVGAGSVFLHFQPPVAVINDYNSELITTYKTVRDELPELIDLLSELQEKNNPDDYYEIRAWDREDDWESWPNVKKAGRMIYLNRTCFNGLYRVNSSGYFNASFASYPDPMILDAENLTNVSRYLNDNDVTILNGGYAAALTHADTGDFVYLDPPYDESWTAYTAAQFDSKDQEALRDSMVELHDNGVQWLYSNHNTELVRELFDQFNDTISVIDAVRRINTSASGRGAVEEVLISNYPLQGGDVDLFSLL